MIGSQFFMLQNSSQSRLPQNESCLMLYDTYDAKKTNKRPP